MGYMVLSERTFETHQRLFYRIALSSTVTLATRDLTMCEERELVDVSL